MSPRIHTGPARHVSDLPDIRNPAPRRSLVREIYAQQVAMLYRLAPVVLAGLTLSGAVVSYILLDVVPRPLLFAWLAALLLVVAVRLAVLFAYKKPGITQNHRFWHTAFLFGVFLSALVWGALPVWLYPAESLVHQLVIAFALAALVAAAVLSLSARLEALLLFLIPVMAALTWRMFTDGSDVHTAVGSMLLVYTAMVASMGYVWNSVIRTSLAMRYENNAVKNKLGLILKSAGEGIFGIDLEGFITFVNPVAARLTGWESAQLIGQPYTVITGRLGVSSDAMTLVHREDDAVFSRKDGSQFRAEYTRAPISHDSGQCMGAVFVFQDTSEKRDDEHQLAAAYRELAMLQYAVNQHSIVAVTDRDGRITYVNDLFCEISQYSRAELIGQTHRIINSGQQSPEFFHDLWHTITQGNVWKGEICNRRRDGSLYFVDTTVVPYVDDEGIPERYVAIRTDITERKRMEGERAQLQNQLQQAQKMEAIGQLTGGVGHDFNNILASIMGYTGLALERLGPGSDERLNRYLAEVQHAGERARALIAQLLTFARETGGSPKPLNIVPLIKEVLKMLRPMLPTTIEIETHFEAEPPLVMLDAINLHQAIMNLCINARDAMEGKGRLEITLRRVAGADDICASCHKPVIGEFVELAVKDTGQGIAPQDVDRIFEPFFTTKLTGDGTGMGLAMVHGIVHGAGGHILVDTTPSGGTVFKLWLSPALPEASRAEAVPLQERIQERGDERILVVDDETAIRGFFKELLESRGFSVVVMADPNAALGWYRQHSGAVDLVLTDQTMPGLTGVELAREMLSLRPGLPIILYTGYAESLDEDQVNSLGIRALCRKPMDGPALLRLIRAELSV